METCKELMLTLVQSADECMLCDSGNPVYLKMKEELDKLW
jgi:hypothetical protein